MFMYCRHMDVLLLPLALQPAVGFGLSNNILPFFPVANSLHLLTPSTSRYISTSSFHLFLGRHMDVVDAYLLHAGLDASRFQLCLL